MQDNNYNNSKFINYDIAGTIQPKKPQKKKKKKILILIILLLILLLVASYLFYINKIEKESNKKSNDNYEEYDPNYEIEESNSNVSSNVTSNVTSDITSNITITSNVITSNSNRTSNTTSTVAVSSISFSSSTTGINVGGSKNLSVIIKPTNATNKSVTWSSSNTSIVSVDQNGKITGKKVGSATITATTKDGGKKATCKVTVTANTVAVTDIKFSTSSTFITIVKGGYTYLSTIITPSNATNQSVTWSSSNSSIASVDQNGKITGVGIGTATITATTKDGNKKASIQLNVSAPAVSSISMSASSSTIYVGNYLYPTITYNPSDATLKSVTWSSSNKNVATVSTTGKVTGVSEGNVTIKATTPNGKTASKTFYIRHDPSTFQVTLRRTTSKNPKTGEILGYYYTYDIVPLTASAYGKYSTSYIYYNGTKITGSLSSSSSTLYNTNIKSVTIYSSNGIEIKCTPIYDLN